jgi:hypothetical protein
MGITLCQTHRALPILSTEDLVLLRQKCERRSDGQCRATRRLLLRPLPNAGEGSSAVHQHGSGEGEVRPLTRSVHVEHSALPSPDIRASTPVCAGYGGEGAATAASRLVTQ